MLVLNRGAGQTGPENQLRLSRTKAAQTWKCEDFAVTGLNRWWLGCVLQRGEVETRSLRTLIAVSNYGRNHA